MMILPVVLLVLLGTALADVPVCNDVVELNPPTNTSQLTWYPSNFSGSAPPSFPNEYSCTYKINVPQGWSATIVLSLNMTIPIDNAVSVTVIDQNQISESVWPTTNEYFFFVSPGGKIHLSTRTSNVQFGFAVRWWKRSDNYTPSKNNVSASQTQPAVYWAFNTDPIQITAETNVSLVVTPPNDDSILQYLRSVIIYDGPDWNSSCLGNALHLINTNKQWVSSGNQMTVVQLRPYFSLDNAMLLFQDYKNTEDIVEFRGVSCADSENCGLFTMDGSQGPAAIVSTFERPDVGAEYIYSLAGSGQLDVYIGGKTSSKANLIASYTVNDSSLLLPQEFLGYTRTYVLNGKSAVLGLNRRSQNFAKSAGVGRKGFFASRSYKLGTASPYQDVYDSISGEDKTVYKISFAIQEVDLVGNTTLLVVVMNNVENTYNQLFNASNRPNLNTTYTVIGSDLSVNYKTYGQSTKGFYLDFELSKSATRDSIFATLCLIFIVSMNI